MELKERIRDFLEKKGALKDGVQVDTVMKGLEDAGGVDDDTLKGLKKNDLVALDVKPLVAQALIDKIREWTGGGKRRRASRRDVQGASLEELANNVDPFNPNCPWARELRARFGQNVQSVAIDDNQGWGPHRAATLELLKNLDASIKISSPFRFQDKLYPLVIPGHRRPRKLAEHPMFPKVPLRLDGTDEYGFDWKGLPMDVKQLVRIIVKRQDVEIPRGNGKGTVIRDLFNLAKEGMDELSRLYGGAWEEWMEMDPDERPHLTMKVSGGKGSPRHPAHASKR